MSNQVADNPITTIDWPVFILSGGFLLLFVATALFDLSFLSGVVNSAFGGATKLFGAYWQVLMLLTFIIALGVAAAGLADSTPNNGGEAIKCAMGSAAAQNTPPPAIIWG